jgi:hypothetical protein
MAELLENGSFENALGSEWVALGDAAISRSTTPATIPDGAYCLHIEAANDEDDGTYQDVTVTGGSTVTVSFSFYLSPPGISSASVSAYLVRTDTSEEINSAIAVAEGAWASFVPFTDVPVGEAGEGSIPLRLKIVLNTAIAFGYDLWIDDVSLISAGDEDPPPEPPPTIPPVIQCPEGGAYYAIWLRSPTGTRLASLHEAITFNFARVVCGVGSFSVTLPGFPGELTAIEENSIIEIWRGIGPGTAALIFVGFVEAIRREIVAVNTAGNIVENIVLSGCDPNGLLARRVVPYGASVSGGTYTSQPIDNIMKAIVRKACGSTADAARQYPTSSFEVEIDTSAGPTTTRTVALRNVWEVLEELWEDSRQAGTEVLFEVTWLFDDPMDLQFRTSAAGYLNSDLTDSMRFGTVFGSLTDAWYELNHAESANIIYYGIGAAALGSGSTNPWGRREIYQDVRGESTANGAAALARAELSRYKARPRFGANLADSDTGRFACAWTVGDKVQAVEFGRTWEALIRAVAVSVDENKRETIQASIEAEG